MINSFTTFTFHLHRGAMSLSVPKSEHLHLSAQKVNDKLENGASFFSLFLPLCSTLPRTAQSSPTRVSRTCLPSLRSVPRTALSTLQTFRPF